MAYVRGWRAAASVAVGHGVSVAVGHSVSAVGCAGVNVGGKVAVRGREGLDVTVGVTVGVNVGVRSGIVVTIDARDRLRCRCRG